MYDESCSMIRKNSFVFALYLALAVVLTWPLALSGWDHVINAGDPLFYAWNLMHNFRSIGSGLGNILDTNIYYPTPNTLALSDTLLAQTILTYPIIWLTNNPIFAINIYTLLTFPIAGLGMYLLVTSLVKNEWAAWLSGALFAYSMSRFGQISHLPALSSQWLPYYFYGLYWFLREGKFRNITAAMISFLLLLRSTVYLGVFAVVVSIVTVGAFLISWVRNHQMSIAWARFKMSLLPLGFITIASLILMYPYIRLKAEHPEITRSLEESSARAAYQQDYFAVTKTSILSPILKTDEGERTLYPTITLLLLAGLGMTQWKKKTYRFSIMLSFLITLTGLILSFGPERPFSIGSFSTGYITLPYAYLYKIFPLLQILRVPARFSIVFLLGLCMLAGFGVASIRNPKGKTKFQMATLGFICLIFFLEIWQLPLSLVKVPTYTNVPLIYQWLQQQQNVQAIIELPIGNIETGIIPIDKQVTLRYEDLTGDSPLATETYRVYFAGFHNKKTVNGYSGYVAQSFHDAVDATASFPSSSSIEYLRSQGVSHIIVHPRQLPPEKRGQFIIDPNHPELQVRFSTLDGDIVYEIRHQ